MKEVIMWFGNKKKMYANRFRLREDARKGTVNI